MMKRLLVAPAATEHIVPIVAMLQAAGAVRMIHVAPVPDNLRRAASGMLMYRPPRNL